MTQYITNQEPVTFPEYLIKDCTKAVKVVRWSALRSEPFFGTIGMGLDIKVGSSFYGQSVDTLAVDGTNLYVNPEYFLDQTIAVRKTSILHEIMHVAHGHHLRRFGRDFYLWNLSCDDAINILLHDSGYQIGEGWTCEFKYRGWSAERIFADREKEDKRIVEPPPPNGNGQEDGPQSKQEEKGKGGEKKEENPKRKKLPSEVWDSRNEDGTKKTAEELEKERRNLSKRIEQARSVEREAGSSPHAGVARAMDRVVSPQTSWISMLSSFWSDIGEKSGDTYRKFDRRAMMSGLWMPDKEKRAINHVVIPFDVSSSVGKEEQSVFIDQIEQLRELVPCKLITIVPFNTTIKQDSIVELEQGDEIPRRMQVGGGTRFSPIFNYIRRMDREPDAVIIFTDLGSRDYGEEPACRVLWASSVPAWTSNDGSYSNHPPFGEVIEVEVL